MIFNNDYNQKTQALVAILNERNSLLNQNQEELKKELKDIKLNINDYYQKTQDSLSEIEKKLEKEIAELKENTLCLRKDTETLGDLEERVGAIEKDLGIVKNDLKRIDTYIKESKQNTNFVYKQALGKLIEMGVMFIIMSVAFFMLNQTTADEDDKLKELSRMRLKRNNNGYLHRNVSVNGKNI